MAVGTIGQKPGNVIVPVTSLMKSTKEVTLTVTSAQVVWTTTRAVGIFYADSAGVWRLRFNISGTLNSATLTSLKITIPNVTFKSTEIQAVLGYLGSSGVPGRAYTNSSDIYIESASQTTTSAFVSGDVELNAEPTTYTTAANLEGVGNLAAYIPFGQAGMPGEEKIEYAPSEVYTSSTSVFDWSGSNVTLGVGTWDLTMSVNYALRIDSGTGALYGFLYIRDTSNNTIPYSKVLVQSDFQGSGIRTLLGVVQLTKRVVLTSSTSYKISMDSPSTTGSAYMYIKGGNSSAITTTSLRAVRIAP